MADIKPEAGKSFADSGLPSLKEWNTVRNEALSPSDVFPKSNKKVWWRCASGHEWVESLNNRSKGKGCPYCSGRRCLPGVDDLRTLHPKIFSQIVDKQQLDFPLDAIHPGSTRKLYWKCDSGHEWKAPIRTRVKGHGCPFCSGKMTAAGMNDLASKRPDLLAEWGDGNPEPTSMRVGSNREAIWVCPVSKEHVYEMQVKARVDAKRNPCPVCNLKTLVPGQNDLYTLFPELASEWSEANRFSAHNILPSSSALAKWKCSLGHEFEDKISSRVKSSTICPVCQSQELENEKSRRLFERVREKVQELGGTVEPSSIVTEMTQLTFTCELGHVFTKSLRSVLSRGGWCDSCRLSRPSSHKEARAVLHQSGYELLTKFVAVTDLVKVRCVECGLVKEGAFYRYRNNPCGHISKSRVPALQRIEAAVRSLGGELISQNVSRLNRIYSFRCAEGHTFNISGQSVVLGGSWCRECAEKWVTPSKIEKLVLGRGGTLIDEIPENVSAKTKLLIRCSAGHEFENDWAHMSGKRSSWCSICTKGSKSEEIARTTFKQLFGGDFRKVRPNWLLNSRGRRMELDGFEPSLGIAFEYQGRQHYENVGLYKMGDRLAQRQADDQRKRELCKQNGVVLIELRWDQGYESFPELIRNQLGARAEEFEVDWQKPIEIEQAFIRDDRLEELREALAQRKLQLLSPKWVDVSFRYQIRCMQCGHQFNQSARSYLNSRRVAGCKKCAMQATAKQMAGKKLGVTKLEELAELYDAKLISKKYVNVKTPYEWVCSSGHKVVRTIPSIERSGELCTYCSAGKVNLKTLSDFAQSHGGRLLSTEFTKESAKYSWTCHCGNVFTRTWTYMKKSHEYCTLCSQKSSKLQEMSSFASRHGAKVISSEVTNIKEDSVWECANGHIFSKPFAHMKYRDRFMCPYCI